LTTSNGSLSQEQLQRGDRRSDLARERLVAVLARELLIMSSERR